MLHFKHPETRNSTVRKKIIYHVLTITKKSTFKILNTFHTFFHKGIVLISDALFKCAEDTHIYSSDGGCEPSVKLTEIDSNILISC